MKHIILTAAFTLVLAASVVSEPAHADRQGGGTLFAGGRFELTDKFEMDSNVIASVIRSLNQTDLRDMTSREFVLFSSSQGDKLVFDYAKFEGAKVSGAKVIIDRSKAAELTMNWVQALVQSKALGQSQAIQ